MVLLAFVAVLAPSALLQAAPDEAMKPPADNMGGYSKETSSGWDGDKIAFNGQTAMGGKQMGTRDTFTKVGKSMKHDWEGQMEGSTWSPMGSETCNRVAAPAKKK